ncbi:uncharacterized protein EAF02_009012 [Botrytis sinoallii]|uniref:uncharacterized protein n=1 Tax=Botrytis sinoallii TaxID=1463999 RepID=UPI001901DE9C|nr:uncharacterized protein EAF02_009012 [Botrytis sinoallii]KAF7871907.1 hypothetical protein EAF02_009012 [Botrytis sinoallii]
MQLTLSIGQSMGRNYQPQQLPATKLTHVLYAFANLQTDGTVYLSDTYSDLQKHYPTDSWNDVGNNIYGCVKQLYLLKKKNRQMKTLLSIGGWTYSTNFAAAASTNATRTKFASTAVQFVQDLGFDGIDIDWEYPANDVEASNFLFARLSMHMLRSMLWLPFLITVASPAGPEKYNILHLADMDKYLDSWHLMAYDYAGSWDNVTGHMANLNPSLINNSSTPYSTQRAITDYIAKGVSLSKIIMGLPLYGRAFEGTTGMGLTFNGIGSGSWEAGVWDYKDLPRAGASEYYSSDVVGTYSYDNSTKELVSYDNVKAIQTKAEYIMSSGLGGAMFWESSGDRNDSKSLISTTAGIFPSLDQTQNLLTYNASAYANLAAGMPGV